MMEEQRDKKSVKWTVKAEGKRKLGIYKGRRERTAVEQKENRIVEMRKNGEGKMTEKRRNIHRTAEVRKDERKRRKRTKNGKKNKRQIE